MKNACSLSTAPKYRPLLNNFLFSLALVSVAATSVSAQTGTTMSTPPPKLVHIAMSPTEGIQVDYTPETGVGPYFYPGSHACGNSSTWPYLTVVDLNRQTLEWKSTECFGQDQNAELQVYLSGVTEKDLLLASTGPGQVLGKLNLAPIGGTDFTAQNAYQAYSYSIVGYGTATRGIAQESYNQSASQAWHGVSGTLVPVPNPQSTTSWYYGFQSDDPVGFAVVQNGGSASITIGNVQNPTGIPSIDSQSSSNFKSLTYDSPPVNFNVAGVWVLVLDRYTLQLVNSVSVSALTTQGQYDTQDLPNLLAALGVPSNNLVFVTSLVRNPSFTVPTIYTGSGANSQYQALLSMIQQMGVSPHAFDKATGRDASLSPLFGNHRYAYPSLFSMVGIPNAFTPDPSIAGSSVCASIPNNSTQTCGPNKEQWFSSVIDTQQNETGSLQGILIRDKAFSYAPSDVHPLNLDDLQSNLGHYPSADDLLRNNLALAIESAPPVPWPLMDTPAGRNAYQMMSKALVFGDIVSGSLHLDPTSSSSWIQAQCPNGYACNDIRSYYTSGNTSNLDKTDPTHVAFPGAGLGFAQSDWTAVATQINAEISSIQNINDLESAIQTITSDGSSTISGVLTSAATQVTDELNQQMAQPASTVNANPITISIDALSAGSALAGAGGSFPPAQAVSGILKAAASLLTLFQDANKTPAQPDPYVNQLGDLLANTTSTANSVADTFDSNLQQSMASFFNNVSNDWQKLQLVGLLSSSNNANSWFYCLTPESYKGRMQSTFTQSTLKSFYLQVAGNYFGTKYATDASYNAQYTLDPPPGYLWDPKTSDYLTLDSYVAQSAGLTLGHLGDYSWWIQDSSADGTWVYNFVVLKNNQGATWPNQFGDFLMGNGEGELNLNRDALYDSGIFPQLSTEDFYPWLTNYVTRLNVAYNEVHGCGTCGKSN
jgi:hypothetical protein